MNSGGKILISSSQNGIVWTRPRQVTNTNANDFYSCFASLDADAADDCHEVGRSFSIYFKRTISTTVDTVDALYRVKVKCSNINGELKTLLLE